MEREVLDSRGMNYNHDSADTSPIGYHVIVGLKDNRVFLPDVRARRIYAQCVARQGRDAGLFVFNGVDTHAHQGLHCERDVAGRFAHGLECSLRRRLDLPVPFREATIEPIRDNRHLWRVIHYILGNLARHAVGSDPFADGSSVLDIAGLRVLASYTREVLVRIAPRLRTSDVLVHLDRNSLQPGSDLRLLREAAAAAIGWMDLAGREAPVVAARKAAVRVGLDLGASPRQLREELGLTPRGLSWLACQQADEAVVLAIRLQIGLRERAVPSIPAERLARVAP